MSLGIEATINRLLGEAPDLDNPIVKTLRE